MPNTLHTLSEKANHREIPDAAIAMLDADGMVVGWTDTAQRLVGYSAGEVVGRSVSVVLPFAQSALRSGSSRSSAVPGVAGPASRRSVTATVARSM
ncbi:PAS domain-containing protein [Streptomyces chiangmaiensis]